MNVLFEKDHIWIQIPPGKKSLAENSLNGIHSKRKNAHRFPRNVHMMRELIHFFPELMDNTEFVEAGKQMALSRQNFLQLKAQEDSPFIQDARLRGYQRADVDYLMRLPAAGIFSDPRTGKTPISITLMRELGTKRNLVVSPASLIYNWEKEVKKWYPKMDVYVVSGSKSKREKIYEKLRSTQDSTFSLIISKDTMKLDATLIQDLFWDTVFIDEAHYLRNYKSAQSKAIFSIKAERRYAITGTPTVKSTDEIFGILHFLYADKFPSYWQFIDRYFTEETDWMGHRKVGPVKPHRQAELQELIGFISVQRKRKDVMAWLPEKDTQTITVKLEGKQEKLYRDMLEGFMASDEETEVDTSGILPQLMRLRQICLDPELLGFKAPSAKTVAILDMIEGDSSPLVIMSMFTSYLKLLAEKLTKLGIKVGMIHGEMSNQEKQNAAESFQAGETQILLCNIISAGVGFTLDRSETILFTDQAWNPSDNEQAEARILPTTEEKNHKVSIIHIVAEDTVDSRILELLQNKQSLTDVINSGGIQAIKNLLAK